MRAVLRRTVPPKDKVCCELSCAIRSGAGEAQETLSCGQAEDTVSSELSNAGEGPWTLAPSLALAPSLPTPNPL